MKKVVLIIMAVCLISTLLLATAQANVWYHANVVGVSNQYICLTDVSGAFSKRYFTLNAANINQQMAVALSAASSGLPVYVGFAGSTTPVAYATVSGMYLDNGL